jgi:putative ABC transport system permease protein
MGRVIWRGFAARKVRALLTGVAIVLGVALMAGTYILTDTINSSFASIFATAYKGSAVVVTPRQPLGRNTRSQTSPITDQTLATVKAVSGVAQAAGTIFSPATFLTTAGARITNQAPAFVTAPLPKPFESFSVVKGHFPTSAGQLALDQATASRQNLSVGSEMLVAGAGPARRYRIVGVMRFAGTQSFGGASAAMLTLPQAQAVVGAVGRFDSIAVSADPGVTPTELQQRIRMVVPSNLNVRTGTQQAAQQTSDIEANLSFLRDFLLIFAFVSLFVGAFIIFNTFSITVAQRTREFGLLRTLGATRRQVMGSVVTEGLLLGLLGSAAGLLAGIGLAPALDQLFKAFGADLPNNGLVVLGRTVLVSLVVGTLVTVLAGLVPAVRATRVPPVAALREGVELPQPEPVSNRRFYLLLIAGLVVARIVVALLLNRTAALVVVGVLLVVTLVVRFRRRGARRYRVVPALARVVGVLVIWRGITGRLARENAMRQPGRTLVTAAALMIGLALVTFASVLAAGTKATINQAIDQSFAGDLIVDSTQMGPGLGIPAAVAPAIGQLRGVRAVSPIAFSQARVNGSSKNSTVTAVDPATFLTAYRISWASGTDASLRQISTTGTVLAKNYADQNHYGVGKVLHALTPTGQTISLTVTGIASDNSRLLGNITVGLPLVRSAFGQQNDTVDFVVYAPGATNAEVQPEVNRLLSSAFPEAQSLTAAQFKDQQAGQVNGLLALIYVLLALSVIVSLFGIVNTLVLSIYERTSELGMMRAIGTSRRQIRQMIRYESVITALIGGVLGLLLGLALGIASGLALHSRGFVLAIPAGTLVILLVVSGLAGIVAGALPARRAARLDPLEALATE